MLQSPFGGGAGGPLTLMRALAPEKVSIAYHMLTMLCDEKAHLPQRQVGWARLGGLEPSTF